MKVKPKYVIMAEKVSGQNRRVKVISELENGDLVTEFGTFCAKTGETKHFSSGFKLKSPEIYA